VWVKDKEKRGGEYSRRSSPSLSVNKKKRGKHKKEKTKRKE